MRTEVAALQSRDWVTAARALDAGPIRTLFRHILPNVLSPIIVSATLGVANAILPRGGARVPWARRAALPRELYGGWQDGADQIAALWWISVFPQDLPFS